MDLDPMIHLLLQSFAYHRVALNYLIRYTYVNYVTRKLIYYNILHALYAT